MGGRGHPIENNKVDDIRRYLIVAAGGELSSAPTNFGCSSALETMSPAELQISWSELFGGDLPHASPSLLRHLIARRIQERATGKLAT